MRNALIAIFIILSSTAALAAETTIVCESEDGKRKTCPIDTRGGVIIEQQLSRTACVEGRTWGYLAGAIWVDDGCRAQFAVGSGRRSRRFEQLDEVVVCQSADGKRAQCAAYTKGGVQVIRQLSSKPCAFGRDWGYDRFGIWVDNGCRAEFAVGNDSSGPGRIPPALNLETIVCESRNGRRSHCAADTRDGVNLRRQLSGDDCVEGRTWGYDRDGVWVTRGCRGEFVLGDDRRGRGRDRGRFNDDYRDDAPGPGIVIVCESREGKRVHCPADTRYGVRLTSKLSEANCVRHDSWGYDRDSVWVDKGCRAEFTIERR